jgi:hypothetical protein
MIIRKKIYQLWFLQDIDVHDPGKLDSCQNHSYNMIYKINKLNKLPEHFNYYLKHQHHRELNLAPHARYHIILTLKIGVAAFESLELQILQFEDKEARSTTLISSQSIGE